MPKIAIIGAGSIVFTKTLVNDIFATPALRGAEIALMDRMEPKLKRMEAFIQRVIDSNNLPATVWSTLDRRKALDGADYVIVLIQVGGMQAFGVDYEVPLKHGVDQCIGDTLGPGGIFRALRTIPPVVGIARDMEELCPTALMLNYSNPMAAVCYGLGKASRVASIGLCHGVQTTMDLIASYVGERKEDIQFLAAGINHMAWFLRLEKDGEDLYPRLRAKIEKPEYYVNEKVRCEVMRHFGYFMTESTGHLSEYVPWFRSSQRALDLYCDEPSFGGESGAYYKWGKVIAEKFETVDALSFETPELTPRSAEYCSYIMEAMETDNVFRLNGNVRNDGLITNLTPGCCVEVPVYVDKTGLHATHVGALPPQLAALNQTNVTVQGLTVEAALTGDPELIVAAIALDPLTSACLTLKEARDMASEMLEVSREWLPEFDGRRIEPRPTIEIPKDVQRAAVPLDPALAIGRRFATLMDVEVPRT